MRVSLGIQTFVALHWNLDLQLEHLLLLGGQNGFPAENRSIFTDTMPAYDLLDLCERGDLIKVIIHDAETSTNQIRLAPNTWLSILDDIKAILNLLAKYK